MPTIISYTDLKSNYHEISELCHECLEPVYITKNGIEDLAIMSMETYKLLNGKFQLYSFIDEGLNHVKQGKIKPMKSTIKSIRTKIEQ
jgi:PHD/YefM family antitoxin component YafN of YafNO toxin-antitoxin module